jgi:hypothetical protein
MCRAAKIMSHQFNIMQKRRKKSLKRNNGEVLSMKASILNRQAAKILV